LSEGREAIPRMPEAMNSDEAVMLLVLPDFRSVTTTTKLHQYSR